MADIQASVYEGKGKVQSMLLPRAEGMRKAGESDLALRFSSKPSPAWACLCLCSRRVGRNNYSLLPRGFYPF
jgi:hypothetical protein